VAVQFSRLACDAYRLVSEPFEVGGKFHCRNDPPKIRRDRLKPKQEIDSILVDLFLELINLFVVHNRRRAKIVVALQ